jgi:hypothetical protein
LRCNASGCDLRTFPLIHSLVRLCVAMHLGVTCCSINISALSKGAPRSFSDVVQSPYIPRPPNEHLVHSRVRLQIAMDRVRRVQFPCLRSSRGVVAVLLWYMCMCICMYVLSVCLYVCGRQCKGLYDDDEEQIIAALLRPLLLVMSPETHT